MHKVQFSHALKPPQQEFLHGDKPDKVDEWLFTVDVYREAARICTVRQQLQAGVNNLQALVDQQSDGAVVQC